MKLILLGLSLRSKAVVGVICMLFSIQIFAQAPANDNCGTTAAHTLVSSTSCNPTLGTFIGATRTTPTIAAPIYTYNAPATFKSLGGISGLKAECWGAGGGGGFGNTSRGGGGGGGGYSTGTVTTTDAGGVYTINVGTGGAGGTAAGVAPSGNISSFVNPLGVVKVLANGGTGGNSNGTNGTGATTGSGAGVGSTTFRTGGNGGSSTASVSGGGGGGAGSTGNGSSGSNATPGAATTINGGAGGAGRNTNGAGNAGNIYGAGGGGARGTGVNGGAGAGGFVQLTLGDINTLDVWYRFQAASTNPTIQLSNIGNDLLANSPYLQLYSGTCGALTLISTETGGVMNTGGLTIGSFYYIRVATITTFGTPTTGTYTFNICVLDDPFSAAVVDYSKSYINITKGTTGGTVNPSDVLEIRSTFVVQSGTVTDISFRDTLKANAGLRFKDSIATRTNEGKNYKAFTSAIDLDEGWAGLSGADTTIQINIGAGATFLTGGSLTPTSYPSFFNFRCIILATYRVTVTAAYNTKINFGGGALRYTIGVTPFVVNFPKDSLIVYPNLSACSDAVAPANLIGSANGGTFGSLTTGASASGTQNAIVGGLNTTYYYNTFSNQAPQDYYYGIANNSSASNSIDRTVNKVGDVSRVFGVWDITGDHTGATNTAKGNKPCDPSQPVSATNPCGYMLLVNSSYRTDKVFEYTASGVCTDTYYEVSAWFKNMCYRCGCDSTGKNGSTTGYIPTAPGDSSGVRPNIAMQIDGVDYYTTGDLLYQGLGGTQTGSDTLNNWVRRSFVFKTSPTQTSFKVTFRNNAPGGGGNDWAIDDIGLRTCYPSMVYAPSNPIVYMGNPLTISDTVRSYFNSYSYYQWEKKPVSGAWAPIPGGSGNATPVWNATYNQYEYVISYTIPGTATLAGNAGDLYRMVVASSLANLTNGCNYTPSISFTLLPTDAPCAITATNYADAPQTGNINWNKLNWSLGHVPTCCESAHIRYTGTNTSADAVTVDITNDICIINLTLENTSTTTNQLFKTILHPGYNMQMNGNVRMGAAATQPNDSCIFIAKGGGTITVNGNTVIGYPADNAYCIIGTAPGTSAYANYLLKGDSLTFNAKSFTSPKFTNITLDPTSGSAKLVNNTNASPYPNAVTFDILKIGNATPRTVTTAGTNQNNYMNDNNGNLEVSAGSTLIMPANFTINAKDFVSPGTYKSSAYLRAGSTLQLGGISGGITGSNFPANYTSYTLDPTSTVVFNGAAQTIPGTANNVNAYGNITLTGTGVKTASSSVVNLAGDLYRTNGGHTFNANGGRFTFASSINAQRYYTDPGATSINFYDFTNNNTHTSGLSIDSTIGILNELELKPSTKTTLNIGDIIMRSSATRTSHITNLGTTIPSIVYNSNYRFVIERYLFGAKSWRFLASPVLLVGADATSPTVSAAWREGVSALSSTGYGTAITGPSGPNAQLDYYSLRGSMKYFNDAINNWVELTNTTTTRIANNQGYMVFVRGDRGAPNTTAGAGTPANLRIKGKIRTGDQTFSVLANKNQSIGNPFASQINFGSITKSSTANAFIVWNPVLPGLYGVGGYENYSLVGANYRLNGLAGGAIRNTIESGEAFFVQNNSASAGSVTIRESDKGISSSLVSRPGNTEIVIPTIDISLFEKDTNGAFVFADGASTSFDNAFSASLDNDDVIKFTNTNDNLFITSNNKSLVVERRPLLNVNDSIQLGITGTRNASYRFQIDPFVMSNLGLSAFMVDKYLHTETALSLLDSTNVYFDINDNPASKASDRFKIVFKQAPTANFTIISAIRNADKTVTVNWGVQNENNINNYDIEQSNDGINFSYIALKNPIANNGTNTTYSYIDATASRAKNWYRVKANNLAGTPKYTQIVMVNELGADTPSTAGIFIYPNPVSEGLVYVHFENQSAGIYNIQVSNKLGQVLQSQKVQVNVNSMLHSINIGSEAAGAYQISIINEAGVKTILPFIAK